MARILINGLNSKTGGGKTILDGFFRFISKLNDNRHDFIFLTPSYKEYERFDCDKIQTIKLNKIYSSTLFSPFSYLYLIPKILAEYEVDLILNLGDLLPNTEIPQVYLFDWPYAVYPDSIIWSNMSLKDSLIKKTKKQLISRSIRSANHIIVQSKAIEQRTKELYDSSVVTVVQNPISTTHIDIKFNKDIFSLEKYTERKLLYLTYYYPHKNLEILLDVAKIIKENNLGYKIIVTISKDQHVNAEEFINNIERLELSSIILNVGPVAIDDTPHLYKQCDALLMPTLLETYGIPYIEAMQHKIPIFTSDFDFSRAVCEEGAVYFNPHDPESIIGEIVKGFEHPDSLKRLIEKNTETLGKIPTWSEFFSIYIEIIENTLKRD